MIYEQNESDFYSVHLNAQPAWSMCVRSLYCTLEQMLRISYSTVRYA